MTTRRHRMRRLLTRVSKIVTVFAVFLGSLSALILTQAGAIYDYQDSVDGAKLPPVDAIVVLAGGRGRIAVAGDIWYRYWEKSPDHAPVLYISGMGPKSGWGVLSQQVRRGVLEVLQPQYVYLEHSSSNTEENARWFVEYARHHGWKHILLMTSSYHMRRARWIFEAVLAQDREERQARKAPAIRVETLSVYQDPFEPGEWSTGIFGIRVTLIEYVKWLYYRHFWKI